MTSVKLWLQAIIPVLGILVLIGVTNKGCFGPDIAIVKMDETVASCVCGHMYAASHKATLEDFQTLVKRCSVVCGDVGTETGWRNPDGSLRHAIVIGKKGVIGVPGTEFDTCVVNWALSPESAAQAFEEVCIRRKF